MSDLTFPDDLFYQDSDEWIRIDDDVVTIGLSDYAQNALNDIVYIELPVVDDEVSAGKSFGSVESVKAASDIYSPVSGTVVEVNDALQDEPEAINLEPYGRGWLIKVRVSGTVNTSGLMDSKAYAAYCEDR